MKRFFLLITLLLSSIYISIAQLKSRVDECFELTSIAFRLADAKEYVNNDIPDYTYSIDNFFIKHNNHKLISYIKEIRNKYGIGYDAVAVATGFLEVRNGKVLVKSDVKISEISQADSRWTEQNFETFVKLLNDFYQKTKFRSFYAQHASFYKLAEEKMDEVLKDFNIEWFRSLFGDIQKPIVIVSLCNGPHNYAFSIPGEIKRDGMVIGSVVDAKGIPVFNKNLMYIIAHEYLHNYTNPRISNNWEKIDSAAQIIYSYVEEDMSKLAYGNAQTTINEWFTNLFSIMYIQDNPINNLSDIKLISQNQNDGFIWMERSIIFMDHFRNNKKQFTTIDDYMPQIIGFINYTANHFEQVSNEFNNREPYIVDIFPSPGSTIKLNVDTIKIRFSEQMFGAHGMSPIDENITPIPWAIMPSWENEYTFIIVLDKNRLEKGKSYGIKLDHEFFQSKKRYSIKEDYIYTFKTSN
ncbi:DUF4932 domain-containing protein [Dysgonomonas sp. ZJ709]|uniref:DUF4932 domain-containing protein n=1 Tax=Dysgonomonas sp. ZJ709 TaxID=2709797 RepID=UPI0013EC211A|nr:DUF4932 domain-containing protein [Dysgonomonas sp. ZJ709]